MRITYNIIWMFDPPTGTHKSAYLSQLLWEASAAPGPELVYGAIDARSRYSGLEAVTSPGVVEALVRQARLIRRVLPNVVPELRVATAHDYGRSATCGWYDRAFEGVFVNDFRIPEIDRALIEAIEKEVTA